MPVARLDLDTSYVRSSYTLQTSTYEIVRTYYVCMYVTRPLEVQRISQTSYNNRIKYRKIIVICKH